VPAVDDEDQGGEDDDNDNMDADDGEDVTELVVADLPSKGPQPVHLSQKSLPS